MPLNIRATNTILFLLLSVASHDPVQAAAFAPRLQHHQAHQRTITTMCINSSTSSIITAPAFTSSAHHRIQTQLSSTKDDDDLSDFLDDDEKKKKKKKKNIDVPKEGDRLPISFRSDDGVRDDEFDIIGDSENNQSSEDADENVGEIEEKDNIESVVSGLALNSSVNDITATSKDNFYVDVVSRLSPSELIGRFTSTAPPQVQGAVKTTILGLIGSLPKMAFDTRTVTTGARLASLMFQLQMTGYMFKNAEYRMALSKGIGPGEIRGGMLLDIAEDEGEAPTLIDTATSKIKGGKLKVKYEFNGQNGNKNNEETSDDVSTGDLPSTTSSFEVEVDAEAYTSELRSEVMRLREELSSVREEKQEAVRKDLLAYIRTLPQQQLQSLTNTISKDVLDAMRGLVDTVMKGIGDGKITPETVTEQSSEAMAQLCMWQLVVGYNLRELEVREEIKKSLLASSSDNEETE